MRIRLLGPVEVCLDGRTRAVPGLRRKAVLAALALRPGEIVSTDWLIDVVWGDRAPTNAVNTLQRHLSYLRQTLESRSAILSSARGYVLDLAGDSTDVEIAEDLIGQASRAAEPRQRVQGVRTALGLWRGRSLGDVTGVTWLEAQARRLDQLRLQATRVLVDTRLRLGEHTELLPELERLILDHPFDEQLHAQLILSLYRTGRQADALAAYQRLRRRLGDELGIEPGPALRDLEVAILRQDPGLDPAPSAVLPPAAVRPDTSTVPAQLPSTTRDFTGRRKQVAELDALLSAGLAEPAAATICAISGTAGVGKTALAMHWANQVADRFPDGQLYLNLRGFDPGAPALEPTAAIRTLLEAFGVPAEGLPASLDALTARYRTMLDGRRVLVLLDNARDVEQVRPLLPGKPGCLAIVTSRNRLTSLVAAEGAYPLAVDLLTNQEARQLLISRLGVDRVTAEAAAIDQIIALTARLPLALVIVAARAATHPGFLLARLAAELQDSRRRLDVLDAGDPATDIRAVFAWSYDALTPGAGRLLRILGLHPGPDLSTTAAASLAGIPADEVRPLLDELAQVHLVEEHLPGRYTQHDLLRTYATELAHASDSDARRQSAVHRLLDHYLHTAYPADRLMDPHRDPLTLAPPQPGVTLEPLADYEQASAWLTAEHPVLLGAVHLAATNGLHTHTWQLAWSLRTYLNRRGHWYDWITIAGTAVTAADQLDDPCAQAVTHRLLGRGHFQLGRFTEALRSLDVARRADEHLDAQG